MYCGRCPFQLIFHVAHIDVKISMYSYHLQLGMFGYHWSLCPRLTITIAIK
jgi:hypothetical protein